MRLNELNDGSYAGRSGTGTSRLSFHRPVPSNPAGQRRRPDLVNSLFLSVVVTIVIIGLALRSVRFGLIALLPNIFPIAALAATMLLLGIPMLAIVATVSVICVGIAVDDTIRVLTVFGRLHREVVPTQEAIEGPSSWFPGFPSSCWASR
jgi:hypothetical protein